VNGAPQQDEIIDVLPGAPISKRPSPKGKPTLAERDQQANQALTTRYDALNLLFVTAEQHLKALKALHPVWVCYAPNEDGSYEILGMTKHQEKWRLCHGYDHEQNDGPAIEVRPIMECPIDVRVRAAEVVRELKEKMVKSKEEYIPRVDEAIKQLTDFCNET